MRHLLVITLVTVLFLAASAGAFDGTRKGFVLGGGLGIAAFADYNAEEHGRTLSEGGSDIGMSFLLGYAWDDRNMIVYEGNASGWTSDSLDENVFQGFYGAAWYHYYGHSNRSLFSVAGLGYYSFHVWTYERHDRGPALLVGGGYEVFFQVQVAAYYCRGWTKSAGVRFGHNQFNILASFVAF